MGGLVSCLAILSSRSGDDDMKGLLSSFTNDLDDKPKAKAQKAADEARPI
jgi:hypothetical protein